MKMQNSRADKESHLTIAKVGKFVCFFSVSVRIQFESSTAHSLGEKSFNYVGFYHAKRTKFATTEIKIEFSLEMDKNCAGNQIKVKQLMNLIIYDP